MKNLSLLGMLILLAATLSACGGGSSTGGSSNVTPVPTNPGNSDELILNSGRGTVNNQDTEQSD